MKRAMPQLEAAEPGAVELNWLLDKAKGGADWKMWDFFGLNGRMHWEELNISGSGYIFKFRVAAPA